MAQSGPRNTADRKNVLVCPHCGHESGTDGDWRVRATADGAVYACSACGTDVTTRPVEEAWNRPDRAPVRTGHELIEPWMRVACLWAVWPCLVALPPRSESAR